VLQMWNAVQDDLERNRNLLLYFFCGAAGPLCDDLDIVIGNVWIRFHRQIVERNSTPDQQQNCDGQDQEAIIEGVINQTPNHY